MAEYGFEARGDNGYLVGSSVFNSMCYIGEASVYVNKDRSVFTGSGAGTIDPAAVGWSVARSTVFKFTVKSSNKAIMPFVKFGEVGQAVGMSEIVFEAVSNTYYITVYWDKSTAPEVHIFADIANATIPAGGYGLECYNANKSLTFSSKAAILKTTGVYTGKFPSSISPVNRDAYDFRPGSSNSVPIGATINVADDLFMLPYIAYGGVGKEHTSITTKTFDHCCWFDEYQDTKHFRLRWVSCRGAIKADGSSLLMTFINTFGGEFNSSATGKKYYDNALDLFIMISQIAYDGVAAELSGDSGVDAVIKWFNEWAARPAHFKTDTVFNGNNTVNIVHTKLSYYV